MNDILGLGLLAVLVLALAFIVVLLVFPVFDPKETRGLLDDVLDRLGR